MNRYFYLRHRQYGALEQEFRNLARDSEKEIEDLKSSLNKQVETANGLEEDLVYYRNKLMEIEPQTQEGLSRSQFMASIGGDIADQRSVNQDLLGKVKQLEEKIKQRDAENLEMREELSSLNQKMQ